MKFRFNWKNFVLGIGSMFVLMCVPIISDPFITLATKIREKIGAIKK